MPDFVSASVIAKRDNPAENDFYSTDPIAIKCLLELETFDGTIWEPACGLGDMSKIIEQKYPCYSSDLIDRGYGEVKDFFEVKSTEYNIVTNPPYNIFDKWLLHCFEIMAPGTKLCLFAPLRYLEGKQRFKTIFSKNPPARVLVSVSRIPCHRNGEVTKTSISSAIAYAWLTWEIGRTTTQTELKWFN